MLCGRHVARVLRNYRALFAKVMILQFLSLGAARSVKRTPCEDEVFALVIQRLVYQKIFLFRADGG